MLKVLPLLLICLLPLVAAAADELKLHPVDGPAHVTLGDNLASLNLPAEFMFLNKEDSAKVLKKNGESAEHVLGIILPKDSEDNSFEIIARFEDMGYVKDDDADKLNADELLSQYKEGNKDANDERKLAGFPPYYLGGWAEKPHYDRASHHVIWALTIKDQDSETAPVSCINYNTRILGRSGVLSMNLVTEPQMLDANKKEVATILKNTSFMKGQTYADFQPGKDKDSGLGIAGLILGGGAVAAAAKLGLLGGLWKFALAAVLVLKKFIIVAVIAVAAIVGRIFGRKKTQGTSGSEGASHE